MPATVSIRRCANYQSEAIQQAVGEAVAAVVDLRALVENKAVLIKVNLLFNAPPARAVCTHPEVVRALIRLARKAGAADVAVGDMPAMHLTDQPEIAFRESGIETVCREEGARMCPFSQNGYREVPVPNSRQLPTVIAAKDVLDAPVVINAPKLKSHTQALYTGAIKNWFGVVANATRKASHELAGLEPYSGSLVDIFSVRPPDLTVMDAVVGMEGRGPSEGKPKHLGLILASRDAVALDTVALECVDYTRLNVPHVRLAGQAGLGETDLARIAIDGPPLREVTVPFALPPKAFGQPPRFMIHFAFLLWHIRPKMHTDLCQRCGACVRQCPVGAIEIGRKNARIDRKKCIECFCCHEVCPHNAIGEDMTVAYRMHRWFHQWRTDRRLLQG